LSRRIQNDHLGRLFEVGSLKMINKNFRKVIMIYHIGAGLLNLVDHCCIHLEYKTQSKVTNDASFHWHLRKCSVDIWKLTIYFGSKMLFTSKE
jgi:hypothetical protein